MSRSANFPVDAQHDFERHRPSAETIKIAGRHFVDPLGRVLELRGANVSSSSKVPTRPCPDFHAHREASYVGRPFPLDEAKEHWRRLRSWGMTFEYLDYLRALLKGMQEEGIVGYVAIHQDVFSRYCGGSGAPGWVVEAGGFDLSDDGDKLALCGAAFLDGLRGGRLEGERGLWPTGYQKLACATMSTLFWGGDTFAPSFKVKGAQGEVGIQSYLQDAFLAMVDKVVEAVGDLPGVIGFELMNEPHPGFIGLPSINEWNYNTDLHLGAFPTPLQSFSAGSGHPTRVDNWVRTFPFPTRRSGTVLLNPTGVSAWAADGPTAGACPWEAEGVWRWSDQKNRAVPLQTDYFARDRQGNKVDFYRDHYYPFVKRWDAVIGARQPGKARMVEPVPNEYCPVWGEADRPGNMVFAPHWYDLNAMFKKQFGFMSVNVQGLSRGMFILNALYFGVDGAKKNYTKQIKTLVTEARKRLGEVPIVFGECGVPMDMNNEEAFKTGNWKAHETMLDSLMSALEASLVGYNLWSYNPANRDDIGDDWNAENFSWYSNHHRDLALQKAGKEKSGELADTDLDLGARLANVVARPYAIATAGTPIKVIYEYRSAEFTHRFHSPFTPAPPGRSFDDSSLPLPPLSQITEIFLPPRFTPDKTRHYISRGGRIRFDLQPGRPGRAYVWYVDPEGVPHPDEMLVHVPTGERNRRVSIWVEGAYEPDEVERGRNGRIVLWVGLFVVGLVVALWLHNLEWARDRQLGYEPWKGAKLFARHWDEA